MSTTTTNWILNLVDNISGGVKGITDTVNKATSSQSSLGDKILGTSFKFNQLHQTISGVNDAFNTMSAPGIAFQDSLADVEAITGVTGSALDELGNKARDNAKKFGGDASKSVETYKLLLSQLGPDLAKTPEILDGMAASVSTLSKTMSGDTTGAAEVLTTAMNQYKVSLADPIKAQAEMNRMMNIMSAGAKEGSSELPTLKEAIQNVGGDAESSGLKFQEMNSAIQLLDKAGKKGAEGGIALRNTLASLNQGRFLPEDVQEELRGAGIDLKLLSDKTIPFTDRLRALKPIQQDAALLSKLFGKENKLAAEALIVSADAQDAMTAKITGTNTAVDQAAIKMATWSERMNRTKAYFADLGIGFFNVTKDALPFIQVASQGGMLYTQLAPALTVAGTAAKALGLNIFKSGVQALGASAKFILMGLQGIGTFIVSMVTATAAQWGLNVAMSANPIGLIIIAVAAVVAAIVGLIYYWDEIKAAIWDFIQWSLENNPFAWLMDLIEYVFPGAKAAIFDFFSSIWDWIQENFIKPLMAAWDWLKEAFGFGGDTTITVKKEDVKTADDLKKIDEDAKAKAAAEAALLKGNNIGNDAAGTVLNSNLDGGSGKGGAGKNITMNLDIKQTFNVAGNVKQSIEDIANETIRIINDKLRDGLALA